MSECLQKQMDVNKAIDSNIDKLLETQENLYEISLDLNENDADLEKRFRDFVVHQEIAAIVETIIAAILAVFLLINIIRVETLEKKVAQYEQDKTIVLEDDSPELVGDKA
jgi:DNA-directed RNA polymerase specialized sigma subunit